MFLRLGWVVGQAGLWGASLIVTGSNVVTTITALSLCAICTNGEVEGGGAYYLISRSLGPVFGGTIGILFFIAQAVATSMYVIGFAESIVDMLDEPFTGTIDNDVRIIGLGTSLLLLCVALIGVSWYAQCQIGLHVALVTAMVADPVGSALPDTPSTTENADAGFTGYEWRNDGAEYSVDPTLPTVTQSFFTVFSVFFPAVTGIMAGANMSGDLKDPSSAIPKGTLRAIAITYVTYIALVWIVGLTCDRCSIEGGNSTTAVCPNETVTEAYWKRIDPATGIRFEDDAPTGGLLYNKLIMGAISAWKPLVYVGVWAATLSSALASLVGAPRILQSVASDKLFPWAWFNYFGEGKGATNEPVRAYFLTFFINCGCVAVAKLDIIAPLISNFFMVSYALTNYACFASSVSRAPGWRPSFKYYNKYLSLFGAALCILVMFLMDWANSLVTFFIVGAVYKYLDVLDPDVNWGPAGEARRYLTALRSLERLEAVTKTHVKTYRPQYLLMLGKPKERRWLAKFAACLQKGKGVIVCLDVVLPKDEVKDENISASRQNSLYTTAASSRRNSLASISGSSNNNYDDDFVPLDVHGMADDIRLVRQRRAAGSAFLSDKTIWKRGRLPGAFFDAVAAPSVVQGFKHGLQVAGLGKLRPNTLIVGMKKSEGITWTLLLSTRKCCEQRSRATWVCSSSARRMERLEI